MNLLKKLCFALVLFTAACNSSAPTSVIDQNNEYGPAILESSGVPALDVAPEIVSFGETLSPTNLSIIGDKPNQFLLKNTRSTAIHNVILNLENAPDYLISTSYCPDSLAPNAYCRFSIQNTHEATIPSSTHLVLRASLGSPSDTPSLYRVNLNEMTKNRGNLTMQTFPSSSSVAMNATYSTRLHFNNSSSVAIRNLAILGSSPDTTLLSSSEACYVYSQRFFVCLIRLNPNEQKDVNFQWRAGTTENSNIQFTIDSPDFVDPISESLALPIRS